MPNVIFTKEEIEAALPNADGQTGTAAAWQMYSLQDGSNEAADFVNRAVVKLLTQPEGVPLVSDLADQLNHSVYIALKKRYGESYGFGDTEPRVECYRLVERLIGRS